MLTPEQLAKIPNSVVELWRQVEDDTLADMCRRIAKMEGMTDTAAWQAWRLEQTRLFRQDLTKRLAQMLGKSETEVRKLLSDAGTQALAADDAIHKLAGKNPLPPNESPALSNLLNAGARQTQGSFVNICAATANTATGQFERALDRAWLQTSSGAFDYQTAVRHAVSDLADEGLEAIEYPSGHTDTLEVAVRRAVLTGVNQTAGKLQEARMSEMGCEFVEVTAHAGARPSHAEWQGKVYHRGGDIRVGGEYYRDFESATGYGTGEGLCGWNCRHNFYPFYPDISERVYSDKRLAELDARNIEYNGKMYTRYEINQMQRGMERRVRKCKRQFVCEEAAGLDSTQSAVKLKNAREQLKNFAYDTGGRVDSARVGVNGFGRSEAVKSVAKAKKEGRFQEFYASLDISSSKRKDASQLALYVNNVKTGSGQLRESDKKILSSLTKAGQWIEVKSTDADIYSLGALTAKTGAEFASFSKSGAKIIVRGTSSSTPIPKDLARINIVKDAVAWLWQLFGMEPPEYTKHDDDQPDYSDTQAQVENLTADYEDLGDAAEEAEEAIEDATKAGDSSGSGSSGGKKGQDILGFDEITKLSDQSGSSGSKGGSGGTDAAGEAGGTPYQAMANGADAAAKKNEALEKGAEDLGNAIDGLSLKIELLIHDLIDAVSHLEELFKPRKVDTTLNLKKGKGFDKLKKEWDALVDDQILKELKAKLDVSVKVAVEAAKAETEQQVPASEKKWGGKPATAPKSGKILDGAFTHKSGTFDSTFGGNGGGFGRGGTFGGGNGGGFGNRASSAAANSAKNKVLASVDKWWKGLQKGKATKTLDLKGGTGSGSFGKIVKEWEGIEDETVTKTLTGARTATYTAVQMSWDGWATTSTSRKTVDGIKTAAYDRVLREWGGWGDETVKKSADSAKTGAFDTIKRLYDGWKSGTVKKSADSAKTGAFDTIKRLYDGWKNETANKSANATKTSVFDAVKQLYDNWKSDTTTKTLKAAKAKAFDATYKEWSGIKDKSATAKLTLKATVSNMKTFINEEIIDKLNTAIHKVMPKVTVPKLAQGTVVNRATFAMIGENGPEAVMPLKNHTEWIDMLADRIAGRVGGGNGGTFVFDIYVGDELLTRKVVDGINDITDRTGHCPVRT